MSERIRPLPTVAEQVAAALRIAGPQEPHAECLRCGACCRGLIIEVKLADVAREPRIAEVAVLLDGNGKLARPEEWGWCLACGKACPFLSPGNLCSIYATRPDCCAEFEPGGAKCRALRQKPSEAGS